MITSFDSLSIHLAGVVITPRGKKMEKHITALPHETQTMILGFLEPSTRSPGKPDLLACALVCRLWHDLVLPILYRRFWFQIVAPPAPDDDLKRLLSAPRLAMVRHLNIVITSGVDNLYSTAAQCDEIQQYIRRITQVIESTTNLSVCEIDLLPFTPGDCLPNLWGSLIDANTLMVELVGSIVRKRPQLLIRLGRAEFLAEAQVQTIWRPLFNSMLAHARGEFMSLNIGCPLSWLLGWLRENPQLQELYYTKTAGEEHEIVEFWEGLGRCQVEKLMLVGFRFPSIHNVPVQLVELVWTHLDNTVVATNAILAHLPNLRVLSLRLEEIPEDSGEREAVDCLEGDRIVCKGLRTVWWTKSSAPEHVVSIIAEVCPVIHSISPPQNVTNEDLISLFQSSKHLSEIWLTDCPQITEVGFGALRNLESVQLHKRLARFLGFQTLPQFLRDNPLLKRLEVVFDGSLTEGSRRREFGGAVRGAAAHRAALSGAMTFQRHLLADKFIFDISKLREWVELHQ